MHEASDSLGSHNLLVLVPDYVPDIHPFDRLDISSTNWNRDFLEEHIF